MGILKFLNGLLQVLLFFLKRSKPKEEKERDNFDEAIAKNDDINLSDSLSDSFDRVHRDKDHSNPS